jgi:uncharacterized protein involved in exopolysaccharide biosynthesis
VLSTSDRLKALRTQLASASAVYGAEHPDVLRLQREIAGLEKEAGDIDSGNDLVRQLTEAKGQLAQARNRYSSEHPDVRTLEKVVAAIEDAMRRSSQTAPSLRQAGSPDNPAYIQIQAQREAAVNERTALRSQREQLRARIADFENRLAEAPAVEQEYNALMRDLQGAQFKYQEVRQKEMAAQVSENLESEQKGERFTLIEPPLVPEEPSRPNRPLVLLLGLIASLAAALGVPVLLDALDGSVRGQRDLTRLVTAPPLAVIPWIRTDEEVQTHTQRRRWALLGGLLAGIVIIVLVHALYRPLDVLMAVLLRRIGI